MRGRCAGDHVACVLLVTGRVGDDVFTTRCGEVAIRDIDGDALFTFGFQPVGEQGEVNAIVITAVVFGLGHGVADRQTRFRVEQQTANQCGLAVIHAACGDEAPWLEHSSNPLWVILNLVG